MMGLLNGALSPMGFVQEGQSYYVHEDHHGLAHEIVDENDITQWQATFDSFGNVTSQPVQAITYNQRFPGQYADIESGLYY
ncbi:MAG: hypothetical protein SWL02_10780, partial [Pseudomonadota bacterium]|nr:hypothetical protein [Pseudomonadota bacterium]